MIDLFTPIKCLLKYKPVCTDNLVFRLHSRFTVLLLLVCAILVTAKQFIGEPISCMTGASMDQQTMNTYCWIYGTFTVARHLKGIPGYSVASPGVGPALPEDNIQYHHYYQWVCFILGLQAFCFHLPRALWKAWEKNTMSFLSQDLNSVVYASDVSIEERRKQLVDYFVHTHLHTHKLYALRFLFCEILNFLNVIGQIYMLNKFLNGQFIGYGPSVAGFNWMKTNSLERIVDPMDELFPKMTKCTFHTYGPGGSAQIHDALCVLSVNIVNEKIFVFIWFWFIFLSISGALTIVYRICLFSLSRIRVYWLQATVRGIKEINIQIIVRKLDFGDWFVLHQLATNVNPMTYKKLIQEISTFCTQKYNALA